MNLQVLVSTINQSDYSLVNRMNLHSSALIINQNRPLRRALIKYQDNTIEWFDCPERGVGKSRNTAILHATGDICLFADDDVVYKDNYPETIIQDFKMHPEADAIIYNVTSTNPNRPEYVIQRFKRVHFYNCLRYGTFRIAVRLERLRKERLFFSLLFGGGSRYGSGEDSLFLADCIRKKLTIYASPKVIGTVSHADSTWFSGYTEKYFFDKGALFCGISKTFPRLLCLQYCFRHKTTTQSLTFWRAYYHMLKGIKDYKEQY